MGTADADIKDTDPEDSCALFNSATKVFTPEIVWMLLFEIDIKAGLFNSAVAWTRIVSESKSSGAFG